MNIEEIAKRIAELHYPNKPNAIIDEPYRQVRMETLRKQVETELKNCSIPVVMPSTLPEPQQWFMEKFDITASRMSLIEHKGNDVVRFIHEYLDDLP